MIFIVHMVWSLTDFGRTVGCEDNYKNRLYKLRRINAAGANIARRNIWVRLTYQFVLQNQGEF